MIWVVELRETKVEIPQITTFSSLKDLGIFLQNYDTDVYQVISIRELYVDEISESEKFIKKDSNIEFGETQEEK